MKPCQKCTDTMPPGRSRTGCRTCHRSTIDRAYMAALGVENDVFPAEAGTISHNRLRIRTFHAR